MLLMLIAAPVLWEGDSSLKFRDVVLEFSRRVLGPRVLSTVDHRHPLLAGGRVNLPNNSRWILPGHPSFDAATPSDSRQLPLSEGSGNETLTAAMMIAVALGLNRA